MKTREERIKKVYDKISTQGIDIGLFPPNEAMLKSEADFRQNNKIITTELAPDVRLGYDKANRLYFLSVNDFGERNELVYYPSEPKRNLLENKLPWWYKSKNNVKGRVELNGRVACCTGVLKNEANLHFSFSDKFKANVHPIAKTGNHIIWNDAVLTTCPSYENLNHLPQINETLYFLITSRCASPCMDKLLKAKSIDIKEEAFWDDQENFSCKKCKVNLGNDNLYLVQTTQYATSFRDWNRYNSIFHNEKYANEHITSLGFHISPENHSKERNKHEGKQVDNLDSKKRRGLNL